MKSKFERMLEMADKVFEYRSDPDQINVTDEERKKLEHIHPSTLSEYNEGDGPIAWLMAIPTTAKVMHEFVDRKISERQLLENTNPGDKFEAIYLCSALVLEEYRRKGIAKQQALEAYKAISKDHDIKTLYVWAFTPEGDQLADDIAKELGLPLLKRVGD